jgi:lysophospholipase L1-like esterase
MVSICSNDMREIVARISAGLPDGVFFSADLERQGEDDGHPSEKGAATTSMAHK